jgi:hypothetical protein
MQKATPVRLAAIGVLALGFALATPTLPASAQMPEHDTCVLYSGSNRSCETVFWSWEEGNTDFAGCVLYSGSNRSCDAEVFSVPTEGFDYWGNLSEEEMSTTTPTYSPPPMPSGMMSPPPGYLPPMGTPWMQGQPYGPTGYAQPYGQPFVPTGYNQPIVPGFNGYYGQPMLNQSILTPNQIPPQFNVVYQGPRSSAVRY